MSTIRAQPKHSSASVQGSSILYTLFPGYSGDDTLTYEVSDGKGGMATAQVSIVLQGTSLPTVNISSVARVKAEVVQISFIVDRDGPWVFVIQQSAQLHPTSWSDPLDATAKSNDGIHWAVDVPINASAEEAYFRILVGRQ